MARYPGEPREPVSRYTVAEAADILGITTGAVRNRLSRGTLRSTRFAGTVYVLLPDDMSQGNQQDTDDTSGGIPHPERDALISEMRTHLDDLRTQLEAERQAHREARQLLMAALERIPQIEASREQPEDAETVEEVIEETVEEAPTAQEPSESTQPVEEEPDRVEQPQSDTAGPQEPERRSLWRRMFGR